MANEKISETIEFLTRVQRAWDGTEQRSSIRPFPRRQLTYDYIGANSWQSQYLRSLAYAQQTQLILFPVWHAACYAQQDVPNGAYSFQVKKNYIWGWRGATHSQVWKNDEYGGSTYQNNVFASDGTINLMKAISGDWRAGTVAFTPVVWCVLKNEDKFISSTSKCSEMALNMEIVRETTAPALPTSLDENHDEAQKYPFCNGLPANYLGEEILRVSPSWESEVTSDYSRNAFRLDNKTGPFQYDLRGPDPTERKELPFLLQNRAEINNMQRFFYRMKGRLHSFLAPTWLHDVTLAADAYNGSAYLLTKFPGYWKYMTSTTRRRTLVAFMKDNTARIIKVAGYSTDETGELGKMWLSSNLQEPLMMKDVRMISYLCRYRFDSDTMVMNYETQKTGTTTLPFMEVTQ